jgi:phosphoglycolate phosphatase
MIKVLYMLTYSTILFDLDGTLTDPKVGITRSIQHALARFSIEVDDLETLVPFIGPPLAGSFQRHYGFESAQARQAVEYYREYFAETGIFENVVYPDIPELLADLRTTGATLALATSKPTIYAEHILRHFDLRQYFALVAGSNLDGSMTDKAEIIRYVLAHLPDVSRDRAVMVGDREHDIIGARDNAIDALAVAYGFGSTDELRDAQPTAIVPSVARLRAILLESDHDLSISQKDTGIVL